MEEDTFKCNFVHFVEFPDVNTLIYLLMVQQTTSSVYKLK